jgi:hypothetical protein
MMNSLILNTIYGESGTIIHWTKLAMAASWASFLLVNFGLLSLELLHPNGDASAHTVVGWTVATVYLLFNVITVGSTITGGRNER